MIPLDLTQINLGKIAHELVEHHKIAAVVSLYRHHTPPRTIFPRFDENLQQENLYELTWFGPTVEQQEAFNNIIDSTENGAEIIALLVVQACGYRVVKRAAALSGSDWIIVKNGEPENDFWKLEVSGIDRDGRPHDRLHRKLEQVASGELSRPGIAIVVRFSPPEIHFGESGK
jgi:hypothetical protein